MSEFFQKKYGTELYLMESDMNNSAGKRIGKFGTIDSFQWYLPIERIKQERYESMKPIRDALMPSVVFRAGRRKKDD